MTLLEALFKLSYVDTRPTSVRLQEAVKRIHDAHPRHGFTGVYLLKGEVLELAAFSGPESEHTRIPIGQGLCGKAVTQKRDLDMGDVNAEPEYLACSLSTKSEAIALIWSEGRIVGQIDIDSDTAGAFGAAAMQALRSYADLMAPLCK